MNAKSLPPELRFTKYVKYSLADSKMEYLCGVTRKNYYFLYYRAIADGKWTRYPRIDPDALGFTVEEQPYFLKNKMDTFHLTPQEFFAEIL